MWLNSRADCAASDTNADRRWGAHRNARITAARDTDPNAITFGKPVAWREHLTKPDGGSLRLLVLRNRMGLQHHVRGPWYRSGRKPDRYVHRGSRTDGSGCARHHYG